ncbi:MAG TPA: DUF5060 domain-containing protein [Tepidisphaeraceae bacterium]|nr:DUF5060 domain-containing protein [Tepidisphaeraceae bacterium]
MTARIPRGGEMARGERIETARGETGAASKDATAGTLVEQWDFCEITLEGPSSGNPFTEVEFGAHFSNGQTSLDVDGFYDGQGVYRVRFMPPTPGHWTYKTRSNRKELAGETGHLTATPATGTNHGPVRVRNTFHFAYADGTPYRPIGTTCYCWTHQGNELEEQTLATLKISPFNKLRMCVFPKRYAFNQNEPCIFPYEGTAPKEWDTLRFNPAFFRHLEKRIGQLRSMGVEADLILFHPYDLGHWGFDRMEAQADDLYLRYVVARLGAFRNVWWSLANEFDFMKEKTQRDWDRYFQIVSDTDPYDHLRSVHNGKLIYDHSKSWVTHASIQNGLAVADFGRAVLYRDVYYKPIVFDEVKYEGDIEQRWGNISGEEMVHRFWQGTISGTYVGHGETYMHPQDILWWSKGGVLHGTSPARIAFLKEILDTGPSKGLDPIDKWDDPSVAGQAGEYYLIYFGKHTPTEWTFELYKEALEDGMQFRADVIDTWNMAITPVEQTFTVVVDSKYRAHAVGNPAVKLPGRPWMALRLRRIG